jgi:serine protease inhibitor
MLGGIGSQDQVQTQQEKKTQEEQTETQEKDSKTNSNPVDQRAKGSESTPQLQNLPGKNNEQARQGLVGVKDDSPIGKLKELNQNPEKFSTKEKQAILKELSDFTSGYDDAAKAKKLKSLGALADFANNEKNESLSDQAFKEAIRTLPFSNSLDAKTEKKVQNLLDAKASSKSDDIKSNVLRTASLMKHYSDPIFKMAQKEYTEELSKPKDRYSYSSGEAKSFIEKAMKFNPELKLSDELSSTLTKKADKELASLLDKVGSEVRKRYGDGKKKYGAENLSSDIRDIDIPKSFVRDALKKVIADPKSASSEQRTAALKTYVEGSLSYDSSKADRETVIKQLQNMVADKSDPALQLGALESITENLRSDLDPKLRSDLKMSVDQVASQDSTQLKSAAMKLAKGLDYNSAIVTNMAKQNMLQENNSPEAKQSITESLEYLADVAKNDKNFDLSTKEYNELAKLGDSLQEGYSDPVANLFSRLGPKAQLGLSKALINQDASTDDKKQIIATLSDIGSSRDMAEPIKKTVADNINLALKEKTEGFEASLLSLSRQFGNFSPEAKEIVMQELSKDLSGLEGEKLSQALQKQNEALDFIEAAIRDDKAFDLSDSDYGKILTNIDVNSRNGNNKEASYSISGLGKDFIPHLEKALESDSVSDAFKLNALDAFESLVKRDAIDADSSFKIMDKVFDSLDNPKTKNRAYNDLNNFLLFNNRNINDETKKLHRDNVYDSLVSSNRDLQNQALDDIRDLVSVNDEEQQSLADAFKEAYQDPEVSSYLKSDFLVGMFQIGANDQGVDFLKEFLADEKQDDYSKRSILNKVSSFGDNSSDKATDFWIDQYKNTDYADDKILASLAAFDNGVQQDKVLAMSKDLYASDKAEDKFKASSALKRLGAEAIPQQLDIIKTTDDIKLFRHALDSLSAKEAFKPGSDALAELKLVIDGTEDKQKKLAAINALPMSMRAEVLPEVKLSPEAKAFAGKVDKLGFDVFSKLEPGASISPTAIYQSLALKYAISDGAAKQEMEQVLGLSDDPKAQKAFKNYTEALATNFSGKTSSSIWSANDAALTKEQKQNLQAMMSESILSIEKMPSSPKPINDWAKNATNGMIDKVTDTASGGDKSQIHSATYFEGLWAKPFKEKDTKPDTFFDINNKESQVPFMNQKEKLSFKFDAKFNGGMVDLVKMDYADGQNEAIILAPRNAEDYAAFQKNLNAEAFETLRSQLPEETQMFQLSMPKFESQSTLELTDTYKYLGLEKAFANPLESGQNITKISVDEAGTRVGSVASVRMTRGAAPQYPGLTLNTPFMMVVRDKRTGSVSSMHSYNGPKPKN